MLLRWSRIPRVSALFHIPQSSTTWFSSAALGESDHLAFKYWLAYKWVFSCFPVQLFILCGLPRRRTAAVFVEDVHCGQSVPWDHARAGTAPRTHPPGSGRVRHSWVGPHPGGWAWTHFIREIFHFSEVWFQDGFTFLKVKKRTLTSKKGTPWAFLTTSNPSCTMESKSSSPPCPPHRSAVNEPLYRRDCLLQVLLQ